MRLAYDLYGFVKLVNCFEPWQLDGLEAGFDRIYEKNTGFRPDQSKDRLPALNYGVEEDFEFMKLIASSSHAINALRAVAGDDCQYIAPDILCVYDDSIGAHRDTLYDFDVPKMLIFLSDCNAGEVTVPGGFYSRNFAGSFAVLSGSHVPDSRYNDLSAQLSDWPDASISVRTDLTPHFLRGDRKDNGDIYYPFLDYDSRYQGYSYIPFKRGDVVIFSTRALHALLPTNSNHFSKLVGLVFLEGFSKYSGRPLGRNIATMDKQEIEYLMVPYNLSLADQLTKGAAFEDLLAGTGVTTAGLGAQLALGDPLFNKVFEPLTSMYRLLQADAELTKSRAYKTREAVMASFHGNFHAQSEHLKAYYAGLPSVERLLSSDDADQALQVESTNAFRDEIISKNYAAMLAASAPALDGSDALPSLVRRAKGKLKGSLRRVKRLMR